MNYRDTTRPNFSPLDRDNCETIHQASLEILRGVGVRVYHDEALKLLRSLGALICDENNVGFPPALVVN